MHLLRKIRDSLGSWLTGWGTRGEGDFVQARVRRNASADIFVRLWHVGKVATLLGIVLDLGGGRV